MRVKILHRTHDSVHIAHLDKDTVTTVGYHLRDAAHRSDDRHNAIAHGLQERHGQTLEISRKGKDIERAQKLALGLSRHQSGILKLVAEFLPEERKALTFRILFSCQHQAKVYPVLFKPGTSLEQFVHTLTRLYTSQITYTQRFAFVVGQRLLGERLGIVEVYTVGKHLDTACPKTFLERFALRVAKNDKRHVLAKYPL